MTVPLRSVFLQQPPLAAVRSVLEKLVNSDGQQEVCAALPGTDEQYINGLLKLYVQLIERSGEEVVPDLWEIYYELKTPAKLQALRSSEGTPRPVTYALPNGANVEIIEARDVLVGGGETGFRTWESSLALCEYICVHTSEFSSQLEHHPLIELGAGTGLVSVAASKLFPHAKQIIATDGSPAVVQRLQRTVEENHVAIEVREVDWSEGDSVTTLPKDGVVVAGDILYGMESTYPAIIDAIETLRPARTLLCNPIRREESYVAFKQACNARGFECKVLGNWPCAGDDDTKYMFLASVPPISVELIEVVKL